MVLEYNCAHMLLQATFTTVAKYHCALNEHGGVVHGALCVVDDHTQDFRRKIHPIKIPHNHKLINCSKLHFQITNEPPSRPYPNFVSRLPKHPAFQKAKNHSIPPTTHPDIPTNIQTFSALPHPQSFPNSPETNISSTPKLLLQNYLTFTKIHPQFINYHPREVFCPIRQISWPQSTPPHQTTQTFLNRKIKLGPLFHLKN